MTWANILSDWLLYALGGLLGLIVTVGGPLFTTHQRSKENKDWREETDPIVESNEERSKRNRLFLVGDDDDPHYDGILETVEDNNARMRELETQMQEQHEAVLREVRDLDGDGT